MKILFISHFFYPEPYRLGLPFAKALHEQGHEVEILTGYPNYPNGELYNGYRIHLRTKEVIDDIPVIRVPVYPSHDRSSLHRTLSYVSLSISQTLIGIASVRRADIAYVPQGPATIGLPAITQKIFRRVPFVFSVQDLWPDTLASTGMFDSKAGLKLVDYWCKFVYKNAAKVIVLSPGMKAALEDRGVPGNKIHLIYNWCDPSVLCRSDPDPILKRKFGMDGKFNIMFAGNMGKAQALQSVIEAAKLLNKTIPEIQFVFIGSGIDVGDLKRQAKKYSLTNVIFFGQMSRSEIGPLLRLADVLLVHLRDDPLFKITIPSKTQAYLAAGKPILMAVHGDAADLVEKAKAGIKCKSEDPSAIANAAEQFYRLDPSALNNMGENGAAFYDEYLSFAQALKKHVQLFETI